METPQPLPSYVSHNSKKRVFPGGGGGSSIDAEVVEISRPVNWCSKSKSPKKNKVVCHEIIDVDVEEDCRDVMRTDGNIEISGKGKEILVNASLSHGSSANSGQVQGILSSRKNCPSASDSPIIIEDDFGSDLFYGVYENMDKYYDEYASLQSHFDNIGILPGVEAPIPWMPGLKEKMVSTTTSTSRKKASVALRDQSTLRGGSALVSATTAGSPPLSLGLDPNGEQHGSLCEISKKFRLFNKFDTVQDHMGHHYSRQASSVTPPSKNWAKKIQEEWKILEKDLPDTIFVRVYESRMDLLSAVIMGADGTPYHDGLFFFDVFFPSNYPNVPPLVHYHSFGFRLNPNLYNCGKVCLSLLNTWGGHGKEKWIPGVSTMLQVLVSIQGLILNAKPYFNEPGYAGTSGTAKGEESSLQYNESTYILNLKTMVNLMRRPPKHFEDFVVGHFFRSAEDILVACKAYMDGAQVGSLVRGGVQDVDEGDKSCSQQFKASLAGFIKTVVDTLTNIGAKDCDKFLYLAKKRTLSAPKKTKKQRGTA